MSLYVKGKVCCKIAAVLLIDTMLSDIHQNAKKIK